MVVERKRRRKKQTKKRRRLKSSEAETAKQQQQQLQHYQCHFSSPSLLLFSLFYLLWPWRRRCTLSLNLFSLFLLPFRLFLILFYILISFPSLLFSRVKPPRPTVFTLPFPLCHSLFPSIYYLFFIFYLSLFFKLIPPPPSAEGQTNQLLINLFI